MLLWSLLIFSTCSCTESTSTVQVRLVDYGMPNAGRVEISYNDGVWKSLCNGWWWDIRNANVVCRMLGYNLGAAMAIQRMTSFDESWQSPSIYCGGYETTIEECSFTKTKPRRCSNDNRPGVICITGTCISTKIQDFLKMHWPIISRLLCE